MTLTKSDILAQLAIVSGFWSFSGCGDGAYPVYAHKDTNGNIDLVEIRFD